MLLEQVQSLLKTQSKKVQHQALQKALQTTLLNDLYLFTRFIGYKEIDMSVHGPIIKTLTSSTTKKLLCLPRGTFKSSITSVAWPLWLLLRNPNCRILIDSEVYTNSKNFLREIKAHIEKPVFKAVFGELKGETWNEGEIIVCTRTKALKEPSIACSGVEATKVGMHFDVIIHDDLCSDSNMMSEEQREKVIKHYQMNTSILEPHGINAVIGTRYASLDLVGHIISLELESDTEKILEQYHKERINGLATA